GMAFPLGMEVASRHVLSLTPWLWGINGAASVCASVVALVIALTWGISTAFWCGFLCYAVALGAYGRAAAVEAALPANAKETLAVANSPPGSLSCKERGNGEVQ